MTDYSDLSSYNWLMGEVDRNESEQASALGNLLDDLFNPDSVIDIGCATGIYLLSFRNRGKPVYGIDGAPAAGAHLAHDEFELVDLRNPWIPPRRFGMALNIEVAEHLQPIHALTLVETLTRCAPLVFFSAAGPGQGGEGHYNEQPESYWIEMFGRFGFVHDPGHTSAVHARIDVEPEYEHCHWLRWHAMMFRKV